MLGSTTLQINVVKINNDFLNLFYVFILLVLWMFSQVLLCGCKGVQRAFRMLL